jgi:hypothetical protein
MKVNSSGRWLWNCLALGILVLAATRGQAGAPHPANCRKIVLLGEVSAGQEWKTTIGQGWVFRILPIQPGQARYSGWDLVVDREQPAGFPDALLLATPPYNSINEREVGTTFGLRAQDAVGWNPRSFRFLTDPESFRESQKLFQILGGTKHLTEAPVPSSLEGFALQRQLKLNQKASAGEFRILDARLTPGISDAAPYAENWALASPRTPHTFEPSATGRSTPLGEMHWMRFSVTLWLPANWKTPSGILATRVACPE